MNPLRIGGALFLWLGSDIKLTTFGPLETRTAKLSDSGGVWDGIFGFRGQVTLKHRWYSPTMRISVLATAK